MFVKRVIVVFSKETESGFKKMFTCIFSSLLIYIMCLYMCKMYV